MMIRMIRMMRMDKMAKLIQDDAMISSRGTPLITQHLNPTKYF